MHTHSPVARSDERSSGEREAAPVVSISDRVLLTRHVSGDRDAFAQLMQTYANPIYGYLTRAGIRPADRDDLFQEFFCKVHRAALRGLPEGPVRPWLFTIAVNTVRDSFRRAKVRSIVKLDDGPASQTAAAVTAPDRAVEEKETLTFLEREVARLPEDQRDALLLCTVEGLSLEDASVALDTPINTIKTRIRRARLSLADAMSRRQMTQQREGA